MQLRFCPDAKGGNDCYEQHLAKPVIPSQTTSTPPGASGGEPLGDAQFRSDLPGSRTSQWVLPAGLRCDNCGMQWWWITNNYGSEHCKSCHDVRIV